MVNVVFPSCKSEFAAPLSKKTSTKGVVCAKCKADLVCDLVSIRAKRSRGQNDLTSRRQFDIRVIEAGGAERLIQFVNATYEDFELRSKDQAIFTYRGKKLCLIQNLTIGVWYEVREPTDSVI